MERITNPMEIEKKSMEIIEEKLRECGITLPEESSFVTKRVIHTTADFEFADSLFFSVSAIEAALSAISRGETIVTDTNMTLSGISKPGLKKTGAEAVCYMADEAVAAAASRLGVTRASVSVKKAAGIFLDGDIIFSVGNAPTALFEIVEVIRGGYRPSLVIAVPVGFVNVLEAKEEIEEVCGEHQIPYIVSRGNKGGSTVAAAILNAFIYRATGRV